MASAGQMGQASAWPSFRMAERYASLLSSVEWVVEAPSAGRGRQLPFDDFGTIRFQAGLGGADQPPELAGDGGSFSVTRTSFPSPRRRA
jgi:hypothetical protein